MSPSTRRFLPRPAMTGYSDRLNHAFAYAAKHHDRQVRKGARAPYLTQPANVAVILTRYGRDEDTVVAGILHDVVEDCVQEGWTAEMLDDRLGTKFGSAAVALAVAVVRRRHDDEGVEFSREESRADQLRRIAVAPDAARWVAAADAVHALGALSADLRRTIDREAGWARAGGRDAVLAFSAELLTALGAGGWSGAIGEELQGLREEVGDIR
ncbi:MAG: HD domain-containing protein [Gemmatimonadota bacterium]|jgi:(p)ppGpp synthase/HD superfamily hydrolase|nr:HD domain-containing protein [Gemmatimonadota bacterium]